MGKAGPETALIWGAPRVGDVVMAIPALKILRERAPGAHVTFVTTSYAREVAELSGLVDEVRALRLKGGIWDLPRLRRLRREVRHGRYERIFLFGKLSRFRQKIGRAEGVFSIEPDRAAHHAVRNARAVMRGLDLGEVPVPGPQVEIALDEGVERKLRGLGQEPEAPLLVIHAGCNRIVRKGAGVEAPEKIWPAHKYGPLLERLRRSRPRLRVALVGVASERRWIRRNLLSRLPREAGVLDLVGQTTIRDMLHLLRRASVLLCGDSGGMHLGTMAGAPMVALFGPTDESSTGPFGAAGRATIIREVPLEEAREDPRCMERIGVERVQAAIEGQLRVAR